jgi:hypothetical protein
MRDILLAIDRKLVEPAHQHAPFARSSELTYRKDGLGLLAHEIAALHGLRWIHAA